MYRGGGARTCCAIPQNKLSTLPARHYEAVWNRIASDMRITRFQASVRSSTKRIALQKANMHQNFTEYKNKNRLR